MQSRLTTELQQRRDLLKRYLKPQNEICFYRDSLFAEMVKDIFVDKTLFIMKIIDDRAPSLLFKRPRRWGKSSLINMLYYFLSKPIGKEGETIATNPFRIFFEGGTLQEKGKVLKMRRLKIADVQDKDGRSYLSELGQYPVIYMNWKDIKCKTYEQFLKTMGREISKLFQQHSYLKKSLNQKNKRYFQALENGTAEEFTLKQSLKFLSELLRNFHSEKVYILIDQYDTPTNEMVFSKCSLEERNSVIKFTGTLLSAALKDNRQNVQKGILTGIYDSIKKSPQSGLNNIQIYGITDQEFSQFYGFTASQIRESLIIPMFKINSEPAIVQDLTNMLLEQITLWYNGYYTQDGNKLHNPYAVVRYLKLVAKRQQFMEGQPFWQASGSDQLLRHVFSFGYNSSFLSKIISLTSSKFEGINNHLVPLPYSGSENLMDPNFSEKKLTLLLIDSGYLTGKIQSTETGKDYFFLAELPNKETWMNFTSKLSQWGFEKILGRDQTLKIEVTDWENFKEKIEGLFNLHRNDFGHLSEAFCNGFIATSYIASKQTTHLVSVELFSGFGRIDSMFYPKEKEGKAIIIHEYKFTDTASKKGKLGEEALFQIYSKNYLDRAVSLAENHKNIETIVTRTIVIVKDESSQKICLLLEEEQSHTILEAKRIVSFFSSEKIRQIMTLGGSWVDSQKKLLSEKETKSLRHLLGTISKETNGEKMERDSEITASSVKRKREVDQSFYDKFKEALTRQLPCGQINQIDRIMNILKERYPSSKKLLRCTEKQLWIKGITTFMQPILKVIQQFKDGSDPLPADSARCERPRRKLERDNQIQIQIRTFGLQKLDEKKED